MRYLQKVKEENKVKLDLKDKKILSEISKNCRLPKSILSKKVGLSRDSVSYRIKQLEKKGVIQGYRTVIDVNKLDYRAFHIFLQLNNPSKKSEEEIIKKFKAYPFVRAVIKFNGKYDFELAIISKSLEEFDQIINKILEGCSKYIQDYETLIVLKSYVSKVFPKNFLDDVNKTEKKISPKYKLDKKDKEILKILGDNAIEPLYSIADKLKISPDTVKYRMNKLIESGIIVKFIPIINYSAIDYGVYTILARVSSLDQSKDLKLERFFKTDENILWAVKTLGKYNVLFYISIKDPKELHETILRFRKNFPEEIKDYENLIAYEEYKYHYFPDYSII